MAGTVAAPVLRVSHHGGAGHILRPANGAGGISDVARQTLHHAMGALAADSELSVTLYRQYCRMDDCRTWTPALGGVRPHPDVGRLLEICFGAEWAFHSARIHGPVQCAVGPICRAGLSDYPKGTRSASGCSGERANNCCLRMTMGFVWFWLVAIMMVAYVVLDGFDLGVGILHPFLARSEQDRQIMLRSIGPVWDGNEVWLLAGGGTLYFAFPLLYASAFSGFYLALMIVLWLLIMRGCSIELRMHMEIGVWRAFFDGLFFISSLLLAIFYAAALANVIRGVPLGEDGYFFLPLWTNWRIGPEPGILDWYTVIGGVLALVALALHGALYLAVKTEADLQCRARSSAKLLWFALFALTILSLPATLAARPDGLDNYHAYPVLFMVPVVICAALLGIFYFARKQDDRKAFTCSCIYL